MQKTFLKLFRILVLITLVLALAIVGLLFYNKWRLDRGDIIKFNGKFYTKEEFRKVVPPQVYQVESKNTPEEVYAKFREALLKNNTEAALKFIREVHREEYRQAFKDKDKFDKWVKSLPKEITNERIDNNNAYYDINLGTSNKNEIDFIKNSSGFWEIDII